MWRTRGLVLVTAVAVVLGLLPASVERKGGMGGPAHRVGVVAAGSPGPVTGRRWE